MNRQIIILAVSTKKYRVKSLNIDVISPFTEKVAAQLSVCNTNKDAINHNLYQRIDG